MKISFWLAGSKLNRAGLAPIYAKVSVQGKKPVNISTGICIKPEKWVPGGFCFIKGPEKLASSYNEKLLNIRAEIQGIHNDLERRGQPISGKVIKDIFTGANFSAISLKAAMFRYIAEREKEKISAGTVKTLNIRCQNVIKYLAWKGDMEKELIEVNVPFLADLEGYLKTESRHSQTHINKILRFVKSVMDFGVRKEWLDHNPTSSFQVKKLPRKAKVYLSNKELEKIKTTNFPPGDCRKLLTCFFFSVTPG